MAVSKTIYHGNLPLEGYERIQEFLLKVQEEMIRYGAENEVEDAYMNYVEELSKFEKTGDLPGVRAVLKAYSGDGMEYRTPRLMGEPIRKLADGYRAREVEYGGPHSYDVKLNAFGGSIQLSVAGPFVPKDLKMPSEADVLQSIVSIIEDYAPPVPPAPTPAPRKPFKVFIGHGGDQQWRILRDELRDKHNFQIEAYEAIPRAGESITNILRAMAAESMAALLILTGTDEMKDGTFRGRENVVHEIGFFQGFLGWEKAIVVVEDTIEPFSNLAGTQQIRFEKGKIQGAVGEAVGSLRLLEASYERGD